jgi:hypothetical protein
MASPEHLGKVLRVEACCVLFAATSERLERSWGFGGVVFYLSNPCKTNLMRSKLFTDPLGSNLPALERNILIFRGHQMLLVLFYAEELKRRVVDLIQATDGLKTRLHREGASERAPPGTGKTVDKALNALVADKAITAAQKREIVELIDYRNVIGHQMHTLFADLSSDRFAREMAAHAPSWQKKYNYSAVRRLRQFHELLDSLYLTHHYVVTLSYNRPAFRSAEKTFETEIKRLNRKIARLTEVRREKVKLLNSELSLEATEFSGEWHPQHPNTRYEGGRLTKRGIEICYRLFDMGKSNMAVAHITGLSLAAARKRRRMWVELGRTKHGGGLSR